MSGQGTGLGCAGAVWGGTARRVLSRAAATPVAVRSAATPRLAQVTMATGCSPSHTDWSCTLAPATPHDERRLPLVQHGGARVDKEFCQSGVRDAVRRSPASAARAQPNSAQPLHASGRLLATVGRRSAGGVRLRRAAAVSHARAALCRFPARSWLPQMFATGRTTICRKAGHRFTAAFANPLRKPLHQNGTLQTGLSGGGSVRWPPTHPCASPHTILSVRYRLHPRIQRERHTASYICVPLATPTLQRSPMQLFIMSHGISMVHQPLPLQVLARSCRAPGTTWCISDLA
jgi:hypothetical protein